VTALGPEYVEAIQSLWQDDGVQQVFQRSWREFHLPDSAR
jgi:hypothetical protein